MEKGKRKKEFGKWRHTFSFFLFPFALEKSRGIGLVDIPDRMPIDRGRTPVDQHVPVARFRARSGTAGGRIRSGAEFAVGVAALQEPGAVKPRVERDGEPGWGGCSGSSSASGAHGSTRYL